MKSLKSPHVSIITATLNVSGTIENNLNSIIKQTEPAEHIIVDGESIDNTIELVEKFRTKNTKIISEPDNGIYDAINKGIEMAAGGIIGILHGDDFYVNEGVLSTVKAAFEDSSVDSCYGDLEYVDRKNPARVYRYWRSSPYDPGKFYRGWMPPHPTFFVRKRIYEKYGVYRLDMGTSADYELMLRFLLKHKITIKYIPEVLVKMRVGGISNISLRNRIRANLMDRKAWKVNNLKPYPWTLLMKPLSKIGQFYTDI